MLKKLYDRVSDKEKAIIYNRIRELYVYINPDKKNVIFSSVMKDEYARLLGMCRDYVKKPSEEKITKITEQMRILRNKMQEFNRPYKVDELTRLQYILRLISSGYESIGRDQLKQFLDEQQKDSSH